MVQGLALAGLPLFSCLKKAKNRHFFRVAVFKNFSKVVYRPEMREKKGCFLTVFSVFCIIFRGRKSSFFRGGQNSSFLTVFYDFFIEKSVFLKTYGVFYCCMGFIV